MEKAVINSPYSKKIKIRNPFPLISSSLWNSSINNSNRFKNTHQKENESFDYNDTSRLSKVYDLRGLTISYSPSPKNRKSKLHFQFRKLQKRMRSPKTMLTESKKKLPQISHNKINLHNENCTSIEYSVESLKNFWDKLKVCSSHRNYILNRIEKLDSKNCTSITIKNEFRYLKQRRCSIIKLQKYLDKRNLILKNLIGLLEKIKKPSFLGGKKYLTEVIESCSRLRNATFKFGYYLRKWRKYIHGECKVKERNEIYFEINSNNYITEFYKEYLLLYNNNLHLIVNIQKKFDPLFISNTVINGMVVASSSHNHETFQTEMNSFYAIPIENPKYEIYKNMHLYFIKDYENYRIQIEKQRLSKISYH